MQSAARMNSFQFVSQRHKIIFSILCNEINIFAARKIYLLLFIVTLFIYYLLLKITL